MKREDIDLMRFRVAINPNVIGKPAKHSPEWESMASDFENRELTPVELINEIYMGHPFAPWHDGRRRNENFICAQVVGVDLDTEDHRSRFETIEQYMITRLYAYAAYTTSSHTDDKPRIRVLHLLDRPVDNLAQYKNLMRFLYRFYPGADEAAINPINGFLGSRHCDVHVFGRITPFATMRQLRRYADETQVMRQQAQDVATNVRRMADYRKPAPTAQPGRIQQQMGDAWAQRIIDEELDKLRSTSQGSRNHATNRAAFVLGQFVGAGILTQPEAERMVMQAAMATGLHEREIAVTMKSGITSGIKDPKRRAM